MSLPKVDNDQGLVNAALEIAARRANTLRQVKALLLSGEEKKALKVLKKFFGIEESQLKLAVKR